MNPILSAPSQRLWAERQAWFQRRLDDAARGGPITIGEQAEALLIDLQLAFCAGAWVTCVILAQTILDADLADREAAGTGGIALNTLRFGPDYVWLRNRRNALVHEEGETALTLRDQTAARDRLERDARRAIDLLLESMEG